MWKVPLPCNKKALDELNTALTYKSGDPKYSLSPKEIKQIKTIYKKYDSESGISTKELKGEAVKNGTKKAIYSAYSEVQVNKRLEKLRARLLLGTNRCPLCGISAVDELDHHLPRSVFEVLAVYSRNLVPLCHICNNKKRTVTGENPKERFIHVYYNKIPSNICFFKAHVIVRDKSLITRFEIDQFSGIDKLTYEQLNFQINRINLNERLQKEINIFISSFAINLYDFLDIENTKQEIQNFLLKNAKFYERKYGLNDWHTAFLYALARSNEFCSGGFKSVIS